jgi:hypothetical protein
MRNISSFLSLIAVSGMILVSCSKQDANPDIQPEVSPSGLHSYGLLPPDPAHYLKVPVYDAAQIRTMFAGSARARESSVTAAPLAYSLVTPAVRNQEQIGSCTGFCGTEANEISEYYAHGNVWGPILSPLYLYYAERVKIEHYRITSDPGAEMVDIPEALQQYGECIEPDYAYPVNATQTAGPTSKAYRTAPSSTAVSNALLYEIGPSASNYGMVAQGDTATVKTLLRENIPVCMGFNVYDNSRYTIFEGLNTTNYTYNPLTSTGSIVSGASLLGGHANIIYGYDDTKKVFLMENSWGTSWGNAGYWYLPYSVFMSPKIVPTGNVYWFTI